ncbi:SIR2 family NAD-dependent protein deacylase [Thermosipho sp. 1070]|uniref:SIR2 family NAD-dependent protein deacylase n=1 Tax=Thermosipho sp. 1070 TaxID=1437364 RepID=UPI0009492EF9|nr:NAD-dependent deacylase [Thermosipho sp. 1070]ANQ53135.1 sigma factor [Thermosipho sp. 1070]
MLEKLVEIIKEGNVLALTGAGISTNSGIPDFRGKNGLYERYGHEIFDYGFFKRYPEKFYDFVKKEFSKMYKAKCNISHRLLARLEDLGYLIGIITQNIDNLHFKAGSKNVVEIHGNASRFYCERCGRKYSFPEKYYCKCGGIIRPDIVFFGENVKNLDYAYSLLKEANTLLVMGSSLQVYPAASFPLLIKENQGNLVIINIDSTSYDEFADLVYHMDLNEFSKILFRYFEEE